MTTPLLTTKFFVPKTHPDIIPRPRLIEQLNDGLSRKLTIISASAGFGKTTILSEWVHHSSCRLHPSRVAWLSLDEGDNDLVRFLIYFVNALQTLESNFGQGVLSALQSPGAVNIDIVLTNLLNEMAEFSKDAVLILDDYHLIELQPIDQAITFLLDHLPSQMHLVIASRIDPSIPISRLRARRQVAEIRTNDLRFKPDEAAAFLNRVMGFELSTEDVIALESRTEGWIAGLQLAALSMKSSDDIQGFVRAFTGSDRYILDYLGEEVLAHQPHDMKIFLLQTSILNRLTAPLCDAVTGKNNGEEILESLERGNLFIIPLDNERRWYRYHHLFADLLNRRLRQTFPEKVQKLHKRASSWYQNEGDIDEAVHHAQLANDTEQVVDILEDYWDTFIFKGELPKLRHWLDSLGPEITRKSAPLSLAYCWIHHQTDADELLPKHLKDIRSVLKAGSERETFLQSYKMAIIPSQVETMEANVALHRKQAEKAKAHAKKALSLIPENLRPAIKGLLRGAANFRLALAHQELGEYEPACDLLLDVLEGLKAGRNYVGVSKTILQIVTIYQELGKTQAAIHLCEDTLLYIADHGWKKSPSCGIVNIILADLLAISGDFDAAKKNLDIGWKLVEPIKTQKIINMVKSVDEKLGNAPPSTQHLVEPLSPRELEILQLITQGFSNREISERLFLALSTVKGHNSNIFDKLGVQRRTEAVARARELGLL